MSFADGVPDGRDEIDNWRETHACCEDCGDSMCCTGDDFAPCYCGLDAGKRNPEDRDLWIHDDATRCKGLVQFPPAKR